MIRFCQLKTVYLFVFIALSLIWQSPLAAAGSWSGTWETRTRDAGSVVTLEQQGENVVGSYEPFGGRIEGQANGNTLQGRWFDRNRSGDFRITMSVDGLTFAGNFSPGMWWTGERLAAESKSGQENVDLSSPRATLKSFLDAFNNARFFNFSYLSQAVECVDFGPLADNKLASERTKLAWLLFHVLDHTTINFNETPSGVKKNLVSVNYDQTGSGIEITLTYTRDNKNRWRISMPPDDLLKSKLQTMIDVRGGVHNEQNAHLSLRNPRDTMRTFIENFINWDTGGREHVIGTMDLSRIKPNLRNVEALVLADYLKQIIDRISYLIWQELPDDPASTTPYVHFEHPRGRIVIAPIQEGEDVKWKFTADTLASLRDLYEVMQNLSLVEGLSAPPKERSKFFVVHETMRKLSPVLIARTAQLENWQWLGLVFVVGLGIFAGLLVFAILKLIGVTKVSTVSKVRFLLPIRITLTVALWFWGVSLLSLPENIYRVLEVPIFVLLTVGMIWLLYNITDSVGSFLHRKAQRTAGFFDDILVSLLTSTTKITLVVVGVLVLAEHLSIPYRSVLAGLGIGGLAVAIGARDTIANFFGSAMLIADRPFRRGDLLIIDKYEGTVEHVGIRSTRIRTADDSIVIIPNNKLVNEIIDNQGGARSRRIRTIFSVARSTSADRLQTFTDGIYTICEKQPKVVDKHIGVGVWKFGRYSIDIELTCFLNVESLNEERRERHNLIVAIKGLAGELGIDLPVPTQQISIDQAKQQLSGETV